MALLVFSCLKEQSGCLPVIAPRSRRRLYRAHSPTFGDDYAAKLASRASRARSTLFARSSVAALRLGGPSPAARSDTGCDPRPKMHAGCALSTGQPYALSCRALVAGPKVEADVDVNADVLREALTARCIYGSAASGDLPTCTCRTYCPGP